MKKMKGKTIEEMTLQEVIETAADGQFKGKTEFVLMVQEGCIMHNTNPLNVMAMMGATWEEVLEITDNEVEVEHLSKMMHSAIDIAKRHRLEDFERQK